MMGRQTFTLKAAGQRNPEARGDDVILLELRPDPSADGVSLTAPRLRRNRTLVSPVMIGDGREVAAGLQVGARPVAVKGVRPDCIVLRHPWSGIVEIARKGADPMHVDLYAPETWPARMDLTTGAVHDLTRAELITLCQANPAADGPAATRSPLTIRITGRQNSKSQGSEVVVLAAEPEPLTRRIALGPVCDGRTWVHVPAITRDETTWRDCAKGLKGEITLMLSPMGRVTFLVHEWSGVAELSYGGRTVRLDLYAPRMGSRDVILAELFDLPADAPAATPPQTVRHTIREPDDLRASVSPYPGLISALNPNKPVALYVPRWTGVATSTRHLFDQALPIPENATIHPQDLTPDDIDRYARVLLSSGATHFVISGGDTFFIDLIRQVHRYERGARFDLFWHSNFLQMGEAHDWSLLQPWLRAAGDGLVRRIGVVKDGLDVFFRAMGFDCIFVPNVLRDDPDGITLSRNEDSVGLWLSGSSSYRKVPYAAIMAVKGVDGLALTGSGLDERARAIVTALRVPFKRLWAEVLPQSQLRHEMRSTAVTLYVTLSECSPMLPLESFQEGVPCLVGPSSHLFRDDPVLSEALIVKDPLSPGLIAEHIQEVQAKRGDLLAVYKAYAKREARFARRQIEALVA
ncbi:MAG: hypothetical protein ACFB6R_02725 [Alphaproteobacteria bacterium]